MVRLSNFRNKVSFVQQILATVVNVIGPNWEVRLPPVSTSSGVMCVGARCGVTKFASARNMAVELC